jgi:hypothetical protein
MLFDRKGAVGIEKEVEVDDVEDRAATMGVNDDDADTDEDVDAAAIVESLTGEATSANRSNKLFSLLLIIEEIERERERERERRERYCEREREKREEREKIEERKRNR